MKNSDARTATMTSRVPRPRTQAADYKPITLRLPRELLEQFSEIAKREDRSLNAQVVRALREWLERQEEKR